MQSVSHLERVAERSSHLLHISHTEPLKKTDWSVTTMAPSNELVNSEVMGALDGSRLGLAVYTVCVVAVVVVLPPLVGNCEAFDDRCELHAVALVVTSLLPMLLEAMLLDAAAITLPLLMMLPLPLLLIARLARLLLPVERGTPHANPTISIEHQFLLSRAAAAIDLPTSTSLKSPSSDCSSLPSVPSAWPRSTLTTCSSMSHTHSSSLSSPSESRPSSLPSSADHVLIASTSVSIRLSLSSEGRWSYVRACASNEATNRMNNTTVDHHHHVNQPHQTLNTKHYITR